MRKENLNLGMILSKMNQPLDKETIRYHLKQKRNSLSISRKRQARTSFTSYLYTLLRPYRTILSFASPPEEIDTTLLNRAFAQEKKLFLPKIHSLSNTLQIYQVMDLPHELVKSKWQIQEPNPSKCSLTSLENIDCILVPGLGFDAKSHRIGYGKGYYDRLLANCLKASHPPKTIGVGFVEQLCQEDLPHEPHDISLDMIILF